MRTLVRSIMEWLGGTVSKGDVGEETTGKRGKKRDEAVGESALQLSRFSSMPHVSNPYP